MTKLTSTRPKKKTNHHALRKLVGTVVIASATYAATKMLESQQNKKGAKKDSHSLTTS